GIGGRRRRALDRGARGLASAAASELLVRVDGGGGGDLPPLRIGERQVEAVLRADAGVGLAPPAALLLVDRRRVAHHHRAGLAAVGGQLLRGGAIDVVHRAGARGRVVEDGGRLVGAEQERREPVGVVLERREEAIADDVGL